MLRRHSRFNFAGSIHFVTTVTRQRGLWFVNDNICQTILEIFEYYRKKYDIICYGYVCMPDHLHALLAQQKEGTVVPSAMADFKKLSSQRIKPLLYSGKTLWRDNYDDVLVPGADAIQTKLNYMHNNPVIRELEDAPEKYRWSSVAEYWDLGKGIIEITFP
jgi:putative transposase